MTASPSRLVAGSAAAFVILAAIVAGRVGPLLALDTWASRLAYTEALAHPLWRSAMLAVTATGSTSVLVPLTAAGCLILLAFGRRRPAVFAAVAMTVTLTARLLVLTAIARPRPADRLAAASSYSFPSGHSTASAAFALVLVLVCRPLVRPRWGRVLLGLAAGAWAVAVGLSRVALVVHWPTDVLGAWLFVLVLVPGTGLLLKRLSGAGDPPGGGRSRRGRAGRCGRAGNRRTAATGRAGRSLLPPVTIGMTDEHTGTAGEAGRRWSFSGCSAPPGGRAAA
jgi:membrane-associated phospholipid phosphatase